MGTTIKTTTNTMRILSTLSLLALLIVTTTAERTKLHDAAHRGDKVACEKNLLEGDDDTLSQLLDAVDEHLKTALHEAAEYGHTEICVLLIERGAKKETQDNCQRTPLHWAAANHHKDACETLLGKGANIMAKDEYGDTPLHLAAVSVQVDRVHSAATCTALLDNVVDVTPEYMLQARDNDDRTPLHHNASHGHQEACEVLLRRGADANAKDNHRNRTPLDEANELDRPQGIIKLLERYTLYARRLVESDLVSNDQDDFGTSLIMIVSIASGGLLLAACAIYLPVRQLRKKYHPSPELGTIIIE